LVKGRGGFPFALVKAEETERDFCKPPSLGGRFGVQNRRLKNTPLTPPQKVRGRAFLKGPLPITPPRREGS